MFIKVIEKYYTLEYEVNNTDLSCQINMYW